MGDLNPWQILIEIAAGQGRVRAFNSSGVRRLGSFTFDEGGREMDDDGGEQR